MSERQRIFRLASIGAYSIATFAVLLWFGGESSSCGRRGLLSTFSLTVACTIWDLFACAAGLFVAQKVLNLRPAAPLLAAAISGSGVASMPFWLFRGYGHYIFEGTAIDVSCFFTEGHVLAFIFVIAPVLGLLSLAHGVIWLRTLHESKLIAVE